MLKAFFFNTIKIANTPIVKINNPGKSHRSEEHTSELQSRFDLVCRLLLKKKKKTAEKKKRKESKLGNSLE